MSGARSGRLTGHRWRRLRDPALLVWLGLAVFWLYIWRVPIWSHDDLRFATRSGTSHGAVAWGMLWGQIRYDVGDRVGRTADVLGELVYSTGPLIGVFMAAFCVAQAWATWRFLRLAVGATDGPRRQLLDGVALASGVALPIALLGADDSLAGSTVMFMSANVGYVLGTALMLGSVILLWRCMEAGRVRSWWLLPVVLLCCFTAIHHELLALGIAGAVIGMALVTSRRDWRPSWAVALAVVLVVCFGRYAATGLWKRQGTLLPPFPTGPLPVPLRVRSYVVHSITQNVGQHPGMYIVFGLAVLVVGLSVWSASGHRRLPAVATLLFGLGCAGLVASTTRMRRLLVQRGSAHEQFLYSDRIGNAGAYSGGTGMLVMASTGVILVALIWLMWLARGIEQLRVVSPMVWMTLGLCSLPVLQGSPGGRTMYVPMLAIMVTSVAMVLACASMPHHAAHGVSRLRVGMTGLVVAASVGPAFQAGGALVTAVNANIAAWRPVIAQIDRAKQGRLKMILVPRNLPEPAYADDYPGESQQLAPLIVQYYALPESVTIGRVGPS